MNPRPYPAHGWFFPAAALYAALIVPLSLQAMSTDAWVPALALGVAHGHEMLFGFGLAVVAGYLLGPQPRPRLILLFGLWLAGRLAFLLGLEPWLAGLANAGFAAALAGLVAPKFLSAAKKLRNQAFAPVLIGIAAAVAAYQLAWVAGSFWLQRALLLEGLLLFSLLMLFMGGRIIAPAAAGALQRRGLLLEARVQPRIEGALIVLLLAAALLVWLPSRLAAGLCLLAAGVLALVRLLRWRLWQSRRQDLICLGVGYGWLGLGLIGVGVSLMGGLHLTAAMHLITVGALGTLTSGVMARMRLQRAKRDPQEATALMAITGLISLAALLRATGGAGLTPTLSSYDWAAAAWSGAFVLLLVLLLRTPAR